MKSEYVYVFKVPSGALKIGIARDVEARRKGLQTGNHESIEVAHVFECASRDEAMRLETQLHAIFAGYRSQGEWYEVPPIFVAACVTNIQAWRRITSHVPLAQDIDFDCAAAWRPFKPVKPKRNRQGALTATDETYYEEAIQIAARLGQVSISMLQRRLRVGFGRAARLYDAMLERGAFAEYGIHKVGSSGRLLD